MKKTILYLLILTAALSCVAQKANNLKTTEKFDYEYYKSKLTRPGQTTCIYYEKNGDLVKVDFDKDYYGLIIIKPYSYTQIYKVYHLNRMLQEEGKWFYCSSVNIGIWREYDEEGNLIKETDEDKKFKDLKVKPHVLLDWFEKQGWIDRATGKGQQEDSGAPFSISFAPHDKKFPARWLVIQKTMPGTEDFLINAETGEIISHEIILEEE